MMKKCQECGKEFEQNIRARYPRKFCDACSKKRKKLWENIDKVKFEDLPDE